MHFKRKIPQSLICCIVGMYFILMFPSFCFAEAEHKDPGVINSETVKATIVVKRPGYIQTESAAAHYIVAKEIEVYNATPKKELISLEMLPIPCVALMKIDRMNRGNHRVKEIMVIKVIEPSTTQWSPPLPE